MDDRYELILGILNVVSIATYIGILIYAIIK